MREISINSTLVVSNSIITGFYRISLVEKRIIYLALAKISPSYNQNIFSKTEFIATKNEITGDITHKPKLDEVKQVDGDLIITETWFNVSSKEYAEIAKINSNEAAKAIRMAIPELPSRIIKVKQGEQVKNLHWLAEIKLQNDNTSVSLRFSPEIIGYISQLTENFTSLKLENCFKITSAYAWRLYELFLTVKNYKNKEISIQISCLYDMLDLPESYRNYKVFKNRVLLAAQIELSEKGLCSMEFKERRTGRWITKLDFKLTFK